MTPDASAGAARPLWRRWARPLLSLLVLGAVGLWIARASSLEDFAVAAERLPAWALVSGYFLGALNILVGAVRWRLLMRSFGGRNLASRGTFLLATFVAHFYNTFLPGSFGGDLVRGYITRRSFEQPATGLIVVFFERVLGLMALCLVALFGLVVGPPLLDWRALAPWLAGLIGVFVLVVGAAAYSGRLDRFREWLPRIEQPRLLLPAVGISLIGHGINLTIYLLIAKAMGLPLGPAAVCLVVPLGLIATVIPVAMAGVGAREATLVGLLTLLGVPATDALVFSLSFALTTIGLALTGGVIQLAAPKVLRYH